MDAQKTIKLDQTKLYGYKIIEDGQFRCLAAKVGDKVGDQAGKQAALSSKVGGKVGLKVT